jgi:hypothetical protein
MWFDMPPNLIYGGISETFMLNLLVVWEWRCGAGGGIEPSV